MRAVVIVLISRATMCVNHVMRAIVVVLISRASGPQCVSLTL